MIRQKQIFVLIIVSMLCLIKLSFYSRAGAGDKESNTLLLNNNVKYSEAREYLHNLENLSVEEIEKEIKQAEKLEKLKEITDDNGNIDFKKYYKDTIFIGDSITEFISAADILPESNVYAKKGKTVLGTEEDIKKLQYSKPDRVMILFGMNDVVNFSSAADFKRKYIEFVEDIKKVTPDTKIYLQSPTPVQAKAENSEPGLNNDNLNKFRQAVSETADETGVTYVDISVLLNSGEYFEQDGIHFKYNFYNTLFKYLKNTIDETEKE